MNSDKFQIIKDSGSVRQGHVLNFLPIMTGNRNNGGGEKTKKG